MKRVLNSFRILKRWRIWVLALLLSLAYPSPVVSLAVFGLVLIAAVMIEFALDSWNVACTIRTPLSCDFTVSRSDTATQLGKPATGSSFGHILAWMSHVT